MPPRQPLSAALCAFALVSTARAQTGPELLLKPFPENEVSDGQADGVWMRRAKQEPGETLQFSEYESSGRVRLMPGNVASPRIGYDFDFLDSPDELQDHPSPVIGRVDRICMPIGKYEDWVAGLTLGFGYAGDTAFERSNGWYGKAAIGIGPQVRQRRHPRHPHRLQRQPHVFPRLPPPGIRLHARGA